MRFVAPKAAEMLLFSSLFTSTSLPSFGIWLEQMKKGNIVDIFFTFVFSPFPTRDTRWTLKRGSGAFWLIQGLVNQQPHTASPFALLTLHSIWG